MNGTLDGMVALVASASGGIRLATVRGFTNGSFPVESRAAELGQFHDDVREPRFR